jgi:hypothetical protein
MCILVPEGVYGSIEIGRIAGALDFDAQDRKDIGDDKEDDGSQGDCQCSLDTAGGIAIQ